MAILTLLASPVEMLEDPDDDRWTYATDWATRPFWGNLLPARPNSTSSRLNIATPVVQA